MTSEVIHSIRAKLALLQNEPLSGGIVAKNMHISDNGSGELTLYGDFTITLKVLDLTTTGAPNLKFKQPDDFYPAGDYFKTAGWRI